MSSVSALFYFKFPQEGIVVKIYVLTQRHFESEIYIATCSCKPVACVINGICIIISLKLWD